MSFPFRTTRFDQTKCTKILRRKLYHRAVHLSQLTGEGGTANSENAINTWRNPTTPRVGSHQARDVGGGGLGEDSGERAKHSIFIFHKPSTFQPGFGWLTEDFICGDVGWKVTKSIK